LQPKDFPTKLINSDKEKIIFLADIIISGSQIKRAFKKYYLAQTLDDEYREKEDYFRIDEERFQDFKSKLLSLKEIIFISTIYTSKAKKTIEEYFSGIGFEGITFIGEKKDFDSCIFNGLIEQENKDMFLEIVKNKKLIQDLFIKDDDYNKYSEDKDSSTHIISRNIIVRFNSMTKKRFFIFTLKPKSYNKPLFQYRKD